MGTRNRAGGQMNLFDAEILADIVANRMGVGYYEQPGTWNASMIRTLPCGCNYVFSEYAPTIQLAVTRCLQSAENVICACEGASNPEGVPMAGVGGKNPPKALKTQLRAGSDRGLDGKSDKWAAMD